MIYWSVWILLGVVLVSCVVGLVCGDGLVIEARIKEHDNAAP